MLLNHRRDLDGIRSIAIIFVVVFHFFPNLLKNGFIGVDIFFVLSGFLITTSISSQSNSNNFNLLTFYKKRLLRLSPNLIVLLITTLFLGFYLFSYSDFRLLLNHIKYGALYASNFNLLRESGYFDKAAEIKPLLHLWSLSIEEQFYIVFPLFFCFKKKNIALILTLLLFAISFIFNFYQLGIDSNKAFYLPHYRLWELLAGSLLALCWKPTKETSLLSNLLSILGILLIVLSMLLPTPKFFPGYFALLPVLGTILLISFPKSYINKKLLPFPFSKFIANISYSLYLWHWAILSFAFVTLGTLYNHEKIFLLIFSIIISTFTYYYVENTFRYKHVKYAKYTILILGSLAAISQIILKTPFLSELKKYQEERAYSSFLEWDESRSGFCTTTNIPYCVSNAKEAGKVLLLGDSNANHLAKGLSKRFSEDGISFTMLGQPSCPPFVNIDLLSNKKVNNCSNTFNEIYKDNFLKNSKKIILSMSLLHLKRQTDQEPQNYSTIRNNKVASTYDEQFTNLYNAFIETMGILEKYDVEVVFLVNTPHLSIEPEKCFPKKHFRNNINCNKHELLGINKDFIKNTVNLAQKVQETYPKLKIQTLHDEFCPDDRCPTVNENGNPLYRDGSHLSSTGSDYVANLIYSKLKSKN